MSERARGERGRERAGSAGDTEAGRGLRLRDTETCRQRTSQRQAETEMGVTERGGWVGSRGGHRDKKPTETYRDTQRYTETHRERDRGEMGAGSER